MWARRNVWKTNGLRASAHNGCPFPPDKTRVRLDIKHSFALNKQTAMRTSRPMRCYATQFALRMLRTPFDCSIYNQHTSEGGHFPLGHAWNWAKMSRWHFHTRSPIHIIIEWQWSFLASQYIQTFSSPSPNFGVFVFFTMNSNRDLRQNALHQQKLSILIHDNGHSICV